MHQSEDRGGNQASQPASNIIVQRKPHSSLATLETVPSFVLNSKEATIRPQHHWSSRRGCSVRGAGHICCLFWELLGNSQKCCLPDQRQEPIETNRGAKRGTEGQKRGRREKRSSPVETVLAQREGKAAEWELWRISNAAMQTRCRQLSLKEWYCV